MTSSSKYKGRRTISGKHYYENLYDEDGNVLTKWEEPYIWRTQDLTRSQQGLLKHPSTYDSQYYPEPGVYEPHYVGHSNMNPIMNEFESEFLVPQRRKRIQKGMLWDDLHSSWEKQIRNYIIGEAQRTFQPDQFEYQVHQPQFLGSKNSPCMNKTSYIQPHSNQNLGFLKRSVVPEITMGYRDERFIFDEENDHNCDADELTVEQYLLACSSSDRDTRNIQKEPLLMEKNDVPLNGVPLDVFGLPMDRDDDAPKNLKDFVSESVPTTKCQQSNGSKRVSHSVANSTGKILQYLTSSQYNPVSSAMISSPEMTNSGCALAKGTLHMNHSQKRLQQDEWLVPKQFQWKGYMGFCGMPAIDCILLLNQLAVTLGHDDCQAITFSHTLQSLRCHCFNITSLQLLEQMIDISPIPVINGRSRVLLPLWAEPPPPPPPPFPRTLAYNYTQKDHHSTGSATIINHHKWTNAKQMKQSLFLTVSAEQNTPENTIKKTVTRSVASHLQDQWGSGDVGWSPNQNVATQSQSDTGKNILPTTTKKTSSSSKSWIKSVSFCNSNRKTSKGNTSETITGRNPGVFPNAVQPGRVVLVVDCNNPFLDRTKLPKHYIVLEGKFMDPLACFDLIKHYLDNLEDDDRDNGILFIVHPWLDFLLTNLSASFYDGDNTDSQKSIAASAALGHNFSHLAFSDEDLMAQMLKILEDFSAQFQPMDLDVLIARNKVLPAANKKPLGGSEASFTNAGITLLSRRLLHAAFQLRSTVLAKTTNCEVLFACCPLHIINRANTIPCLKEQLNVPAWVLPELIGQLMTALRVWNKFCSNQWRLGNVPYAEYYAGLELYPANKLTSLLQPTVITGTSCNDNNKSELHQKCKSEAIDTCAEKIDLQTFIDWAKETGIFDKDEVLVAPDSIVHNTSSLDSCEHNNSSDGEEALENKICQTLVNRSPSQITDGNCGEGIEEKSVTPNLTILNDMSDHALDLATDHASNTDLATDLATDDASNTDHASNRADNSSGSSDVPLLRAVDGSTNDGVEDSSCCRESRQGRGKQEELLAEMSGGEAGRTNFVVVCIPGAANIGDATSIDCCVNSSADATSSADAATSSAGAATSSADAATSGADAATSSADAATSGADAATSSADAATSGADAATSSADAATSIVNAATSNADAVTGRAKADAVKSSADTATSSADAVTSSTDSMASSADAVTSNADAVTSSADAVTSSADAVTSSASSTTGKAAADDDVTSSSDAVTCGPAEAITSSSAVTNSTNAVVSILSATNMGEIATLFPEVPQEEIGLPDEVGDDTSKTLHDCNLTMMKFMQSLSHGSAGMYDKGVDVDVVEDPLIPRSPVYSSQHGPAKNSEAVKLLVQDSIIKKLSELSTDECSVCDESSLNIKLQDSVKASSVNGSPKQDQGSAEEKSTTVKLTGVTKPFRLLGLFKVPPSETSASLPKPTSRRVTPLKSSDNVSCAEAPESNLARVKEDAHKQVSCPEAVKEVDSASFCCRPLGMLSKQLDMFGVGSVQGRTERDELVARHTEAVVEDTNRAIDVLSKRANVRVFPWDVFPGSVFTEVTLPSVLAKSIELKILLEVQVDANQKSAQYWCSLCDVQLGSLAAADVHCHASSHVGKVQPTLIMNLHEENVALLTGKRPAPVSNGIRQDKESLLMTAGIISRSHLNEPSSSGRWKCLICRESEMTVCSMRFHLNSRRHRKAVCRWLRAPQMLSFSHLFDYWDHAKSLLSHPPLDVVLLADNIHCQTLSNFSNMHRRVTVVTKEGLLAGDRSAWEELLQKDLLPRGFGLNAEAADQEQAARGVDKNVLWMVVAGSDLLSKEASEGTKLDQEHAIQQAFQSLANFRSFLRWRVPGSHKVIVTPILPLHLLSPALPHPLLQHLLNRTNSVVTQEALLPALRKTYTDLSARVFTLHKMLAYNENIFNIPSSAVPSAVVEVPAGGVVGGLLYELTPWHVAMEGIVITAVGGMPAARAQVAYSKNKSYQTKQLKNTKTCNAHET